eukprot:364209_1
MSVQTSVVLNIITNLLFAVSLSAYNVDDDTHMKLDPAPFLWGVASGEPTTSSVILWTRVKIEEHSVNVSISTNKSMKDIITSTKIPHSSKDNDYSVHIKINNLSPDTTYYYQFEVNNKYSRIGRTKTAPSTERTVRIGVITCSSHCSGWYNSYRGLLSKNIDFVIHMGDVDYNTLPGRGGKVEKRRVPTPEPAFTNPHNLENWRKLHAFFRQDVDYRNLLAHVPWIVQWDNHDVRNEGGEQAFFEWFPLLKPSDSHYSSEKDAYRIDRQIAYGPLLDIFVIDTHLAINECKTCLCFVLYALCFICLIIHLVQTYLKITAKSNTS